MLEFSTDKDFLLKGFNEDKKKEVGSMIKKSFKLLLALLEANKDKEMLRSMRNLMDFESLIKILENEFRNYCTEKGHPNGASYLTIDAINKFMVEDVFGAEMADAFDVFFLITMLYENTPDFLSKKDALDPIEKKAYKFFEYHSASIEVVFEDTLYKLPFIIQPSCRYIDLETKMNFIKGIKRDTPKDKVTDILMDSPKLFDLIDHYNWLFGNRAWLPLNTLTILRGILFIIAFILNAWMIVFFKKALYYGKAVSHDEFNEEHLILQIGGICHTSLAALTIIYYSIFKTPIIIQEGWRNHFEQYGTLMMNKQDKSGHWEDIDLSFRKVAISEYSFRDKADLLSKIHNQLGEPNVWCSMEVFVYNLTFLIGDKDLQYLGSVVTLSASALMLNEAFYYSIQLLEFIQHFEMLKNVTRAVTKNYDQVLYATAFAILVINIYVFAAFFYLQPDFYMGDSNNWGSVVVGEGTCSTMIHCF